MRFEINTVGKLKELIKDLPDDTVILTEGSDHSYYRPNIHVGPAEFWKGDYFEYYDEGNMFEGGKKIEKTLIIGG